MMTVIEDVDAARQVLEHLTSTVAQASAAMVMADELMTQLSVLLDSASTQINEARQLETIVPPESERPDDA